MTRKPVYGPTYEEMLNPEKINPDIRDAALRKAESDPLDPINLFNISWKSAENQTCYVILTKEFTGIDTPIVVLLGSKFPTGSHKVGATYSVCMEKQLKGEILPGEHTVVWPSTGNYGIGGAWVGTRMGYDSLVLLPEEMSRERFEKIESYGARYIRTPGCESNVKEIYDKANELAQDSKHVVLNQFSEFANYRFHYHVTGNSIIHLVKDLSESGKCLGRPAAFVSAMGSSGTIAAGDRLKDEFSDALTVGVEPVQCPTLFCNGYGGHDIQGIGDKHVTWIHNVQNMDALCCIDDMDCKKELQVLTEPAGLETLVKYHGIEESTAKLISGIFGISGICNLLASIKVARFYGFGSNEMIITVATDAIDRYYSVMNDLNNVFGRMDTAEAHARHVSIVHGVKTDWFQEGTKPARDRWFNLKYYTWVEQQGKSVEELNAQKSREFWQREQELAHDINKKLETTRGFSSSG